MCCCILTLFFAVLTINCVAYMLIDSFIYYLGRRVGSGEGIVTLGVRLCVCVRRAATARRISLEVRR